MKVCWDEQFSYRIPVTLVDPLRLGRRNEPVRLDLIFDICRPHPDSISVVDNEGVEVPNQIIRAGKGADGQLDYASPTSSQTSSEPNQDLSSTTSI
jgi:hypothetical protein